MIPVGPLSIYNESMEIHKYVSLNRLACNIHNK